MTTQTNQGNLLPQYWKVAVAFFTFVFILPSCGGDNFDQKSFNIMAAEIKAEINKLSIPCGIEDKTVEVGNISAVQFKNLSGSTASLEKFKKYTLIYDIQSVDIVINKTTPDGIQFKYTTDITEYSLDSKPVVTRDEGTIWMYCDDHKKHNDPKAAPEVTPSKMITVE